MNQDHIPMEENSDLEGLKSGLSKVREFIRFINRSDRIIGIFWINFAGLPEFYQTLKPMQFLDINTFVDHPWICVDTKTKERYLANGARIYYPSPGYKNRVKSSSICDRRRVPVIISRPLRDLKRLAYMQLVQLISKDSDVDTLDLPCTLKEELKLLIRRDKANF